jgi:molybdate transport system ATP-binding protein
LFFFSSAIFGGSLGSIFMAQLLIELRNVGVVLSGRPVLFDMEWSLRPGEHWAVLGGNGSGKSTFLKLLRGEIWPAPGRGERIYRLDGEEQRTAVDVKEQMPLVSPEAQDRYLQLEWRHRVIDVVHSGFGGTDYLFGKPGKTERARASEVTRLLGIEMLSNRDVQSLSTGELRRVLIARALVARPKILLLDEVCDGLDARARLTLLETLNRIARAGTQLVYTTHRESELIPAITHTLVLDRGRIVSQGRWSKASASMRKGRSPAISKPASKGRVLIQIENASVYLSRARVLREVCWSMREGENWAVLGGNGAGKSTFLKLVSGDIHPAVGAKIRRFDFTARNTLWELRRRVGFVSPGLQAAYREPLTGRQVVASGFFSSVGLLDRVSPAQWSRVDELFRSFRMSRLAEAFADRMSYGEFRKILLLRALVHNPQVLACDEPFDGLDRVAKRSFSKALDAIARNGTRLLTVTHHIDELPAATTHALVLERGRVVCQGELATVRRHPVVRSLFGG